MHPLLWLTVHFRLGPSLDHWRHPDQLHTKFVPGQLLPKATDTTTTATTAFIVKSIVVTNVAANAIIKIIAVVVTAANAIAAIAKRMLAVDVATAAAVAVFTGDGVATAIGFIAPWYCLFSPRHSKDHQLG